MGEQTSERTQPDVYIQYTGKIWTRGALLASRPKDCGVGGEIES